MTEQLEVEPQHRVLEIGTGSGYQAAILSRLAREVVSIERYRTLADAARERLKTLGYANVTVRLPATAWPARRIWRRSTASWSRPRPRRCRRRWSAQLAEGGKMVLPVGPRHDAQYIVRLTKQPGGAIDAGRS